MFFQKFFIIFVCLLYNVPIGTTQNTISISTEKINHTNYAITIHFTLNTSDFIYHDYLTISADSPAITLSDWHTSANPASQYDPLFKQTKKIYNQSFDVMLNAQTQRLSNTNTYLHIAYYQHSHKKIQHVSAPLTMFNTLDTEKTHSPEKKHTKKMASAAFAQSIQKNRWQQCAYLATIIMQSPWLYSFFILCIGIILCILLSNYAKKRSISVNQRIFIVSTGACIYGAILIIPWHLASWILATLVTTISVLCMHTTENSKKSNKKLFYEGKIFICMLTLILSIFLYAKAYQAHYIYKYIQLIHTKSMHKKSLKQLS